PGGGGEDGEVRCGVSPPAQRRTALGFHDRALQELADLRVRGEERFDPAAERVVAGTGFLQVGGTRRGRGFLQRGEENHFRLRWLIHDRAPRWRCHCLQCEKTDRPPARVDRFFFAALQFAVKPGAGKGPPALGGGDGDAEGGGGVRGGEAGEEA